ncbi:MAG: hypothetical protein OIF58_02945 [Cohaesibacter sp.]|nr:hypothetical protein [Cohaesibacter sp.]
MFVLASGFFGSAFLCFLQLPIMTIGNPYLGLQVTGAYYTTPLGYAVLAIAVLCVTLHLNRFSRVFMKGAKRAFLASIVIASGMVILSMHENFPKTLKAADIPLRDLKEPDHLEYGVRLVRYPGFEEKQREFNQFSKSRQIIEHARTFPRVEPASGVIVMPALIICFLVILFAKPDKNLIINSDAQTTVRGYLKGPSKSYQIWGYSFVLMTFYVIAFLSLFPAIFIGLVGILELLVDGETGNEKVFYFGLVALIVFVVSAAIISFAAARLHKL